jgi:predicted TIM-barrel fold metal-dependent hydrolase
MDSSNPQQNPIIDADAHVVETEHTWDYMDGSDKQYRPVSLEAREEAGVKLQFWLIDGKVRGARFPIFSAAELARRAQKAGRRFAEDQESREMGNVDLRLEYMDRNDVDIQVLHNSIFIESVSERPAVEVALCLSWNRWLADIWRQSNGRLRWSCVAPTLSMSDALEQIRFAKQNGACAVLMRPIEGNRFLCDSYFYPIYDEASRLDLPIAVHIANGNRWLTDLYDQTARPVSGFRRFRVPTVAAFNDVLLSEIHEVFPRLRWGFIEASSQWLPWVLREAKSRFKGLGRDWPQNIARAYGMFVTCENSDDLPYVVEQCGEDCLVIGTDYGHTDTSSDIDAIKIFRERNDLNEEQKRKILSDNARALYGL